jgi:hypothetical protein
MKILKYILIVLIFCTVLFLFFRYEKGKIAEAPVANDPVVDNTGKKVELCFAQFSKPNENGLYDKYTLRLILDGEKAIGELNFVPGEKDSKTGEIQGTVAPVDKKTMTRIADLWWYTYGEGINAKEQIKIIFGEGVASIGAGELIDRGDGVYIYQDPNNLHWDLQFNDISCLDLAERVNVEEYLKENIATLSPVKAVLGGSWYIFSNVIDLEKNSGTIIYEDGHIQEKRTYSYTTNQKREVTSLTID